MSVSKTLIRKSFMIGARYSGLTSIASPMLAGQGAILMLHRVGKPINKSGINRFLSIDGTFLNRLLTELKFASFKFVTMDEAVDRIKSGHSDEKYLTLTLDDGYRDNLLTAAPIFINHDVPFTIYSCTGLLDETAYLWWEVLAAILEKHDQIALPTAQGERLFSCKTNAEKQAAYDQLITYFLNDVDEYTQREIVSSMALKYGVDPQAHCRKAIMNWSELKKIAQYPLCTIGAHTLHHYHLARLSREDALEECFQSGERLKEMLGERPQHFAYPYGGEIAVGHRESEIAQEAGFTSAVTTRHGLIHPDHANHIYGLPRISINGEYQRTHYVKTLLSGITVPFANKGKKLITF